jgi:hypothetical protein
LQLSFQTKDVEPINEIRKNQINPEAILIVKATNVVLKKNAKTQCTKPVRLIFLLVKLTSAVCPEVPITQAKYRKSLYSGMAVPGNSKPPDSLCAFVT